MLFTSLDYQKHSSSLQIKVQVHKLLLLQFVTTKLLNQRVSKVGNRHFKKCNRYSQYFTISVTIVSSALTIITFLLSLIPYFTKRLKSHMQADLADGKKPLISKFYLQNKILFLNKNYANLVLKCNKCSCRI